MAVQILTDSTSYLSEETRRTLNIRMVSLNLSFGRESMREVDIENFSFYTMMAEKGIPTSSQPSTGEMYKEMEKAVQTGDSLCCVFLSSDMSGTFSTGQIVKEMILETYPGAKIEIIDSRSNCQQLGYVAIRAARAAKEGKTLDQVKKVALETIQRTRFLFIPENLEYLKKGGRIGGAGALIGNLFKIIPVLTVEDGKTTVLMKVRTKQNAIKAMVDKMLQDISLYGLGEIAVVHINCLKEAEELARQISEKLNAQVDVLDIGPVIGLHVGPGAIGITYYTKNAMR
ncbi:EDD domain protein, DegV family [Desulfosporosinus orientis DSM 765]|uniref:EDD domain protein, DegV family n=1 Tax=Desulfosporosinus orientis (strain ATCC 19365 / DSM 765 / NCIMB 8382 / VKM B-1628 / Singapore I) TaxID=768706 RepID=G7WDN3_DESOD|nr:DegV family protein [Desulfosporosinus orientis]AET68358.1 EDD domain protein, DegV family [Desulfosporosinus orientis DSM 765]